MNIWVRGRESFNHCITMWNEELLITNKIWIAIILLLSITIYHVFYEKMKYKTHDKCQVKVLPKFSLFIIYYQTGPLKSMGHKKIPLCIMTVISNSTESHSNLKVWIQRWEWNHTLQCFSTCSPSMRFVKRTYIYVIFCNTRRWKNSYYPSLIRI